MLKKRSERLKKNSKQITEKTQEERLNDEESKALAKSNFPYFFREQENKKEIGSNYNIIKGDHKTKIIKKADNGILNVFARALNQVEKMKSVRVYSSYNTQNKITSENSNKKLDDQATCLNGILSNINQNTFNKTTSSHIINSNPTNTAKSPSNLKKTISQNSIKFIPNSNHTKNRIVSGTTIKLKDFNSYPENKIEDRTYSSRR